MSVYALCGSAVIRIIVSKFVLEVDASYQGLFAILSQVQQGKKRVLTYFSRTLRPSECNAKSCSKLELMSLK